MPADRLLDEKLAQTYEADHAALVKP